MQEDVFRVVEIIGGASALSLLAWLVRRTFTHTIPRLADDFKASLATVTNFFKEELTASRNAFREELKEQRSDFQDSMRQLREDFRGEVQYLGQRIDRLSDVVRDKTGTKVSE